MVRNISVWWYIAVILLLTLAVCIWIHVVYYYERHQEDIWLQVESIATTLAFPYKLAKLYREEPVTTIPVPVHGIRAQDIADTWGEARAEGRTHEGVDIFAERGTPIYAAAPGYVLRAGENNLGGISVFTVGPGGIRYYYAHLDSIAEGIAFATPVTTDTVIGFVGNSGNASGTPPHLHLGIYNNGPQNPYPFLVDRR